VVVDNLTTRMGDPVREFEERSHQPLYLPPPYSPDPNPIEQAFSTMTGILRKSAGQKPRGTIEAIDIGRLRRSPLKTQKASSDTADIGIWVNCCDRYCRMFPRTAYKSRGPRKNAGARRRD
jgi:hypothetical protein